MKLNLLLQSSDSVDETRGVPPSQPSVGAWYKRFVTDGLILWGFVKDNVYVPPLPTTLHELKTWIREACVNTDQEIGLILLEPLVALTLNFINDKLLFIQLFKLVFQLVRVL
jgi:hypothetical protein